VNKLKVGDGMAEDTNVGPLIDRNAFNKVKSHLDDALAKGAVKVAGGILPELTGNFGAFFPPTLIKNCTADMECYKDETFGPLIPIFAFKSTDEVIKSANDTEFGLASYVFTNDDVTAEKVIRNLRFGHAAHNTGSGPTPEAPFGGMKQSGYGREGGDEGLFEFVEPQTSPRG
jgi:succinate-semialdehyde dehydrogenase/glutarate-semialdehyde dehydrogenase